MTELISTFSSEKDGVTTTTTVFNPTGVHVWEIPTRNNNTHGTLLGRDPITGEMTHKLEMKDGKRVDGWTKPGVEHLPIQSRNGEEKAWVWANPGTASIVRARVEAFYKNAENNSPPRGDLKPAGAADQALRT